MKKIKKTRLEFSQRNVTILWKTVSYEEARVKLTKTQLSKLKTAGKKTATTLGTTKKTLKIKNYHINYL